jgi:nucleoside-diphosphate-sugar epimerase
MRVAIAGSGNMAHYMSEEFSKAGHGVVILARTRKSHFPSGVAQVITDYSIASLRKALYDRDVLISTILDYSMQNVDVHLNLIEACKQSSKCKRFIPSEYAGNLEEYPDLPSFYYENHEPIRQALRQQEDLEWTIICVGWFSDYVVPSRNRYIRDIGGAHPIDLGGKSILIPGTGKEPIDLTSARDVAKGMASLVAASKWEPYTYLSGEQTNWRKIADLVKKRDPSFQIRFKSLAQIVDTIVASESEEAVLFAQFQLFSAAGAAALPPEKVQSQREMFFKDVHFRSVQELFQEVDADPSVIV